MKNFAPVFIGIATVFSFSCLAQNKDHGPARTKVRNAHISEGISEGQVVIAYHVEERRNSNFGSHITTYNVSHISLVPKNELGPNNSRVVTPIYGISRGKAVAMPLQISGIVEDELPTSAPFEIPLPEQPVKVEAVAETQVSEPKVEEVAPPEERPKFAYVNVTETYERILKKGYKSIDMFKRVANSKFFDGDLVTAAKYYSELFAMTKDLDDEYYFRYAKALKSIKQIHKADEMMAIFESKVAKNQ